METIRSVRKSNGSRRVALSFKDEKGCVRREFKKECDINVIMSKFQKTGALTHFAKHSANYGFAPAVDFHRAMEIVRTAQEMFNDLPSKVRNKFENDPARFLEFVQDENNGEEMRALGLRPPKAKSEIEVLGDRLEAALRTPPEAGSPGGEGTGTT